MESRKQDIIIQIGSQFLRVGLVGDRSPRKTIASQSPISSSPLLEVCTVPLSITPQSQIQLQQTIYSIFYTHINSSALNKTVILLEHVYTDRRILESIAKILFKKFKIQKIQYSLNCVTPLYLTGRISGVVVSGGASCVEILATFQSFPLMRQFKYVPTGTNAMLKVIKDQLLLINPQVSSQILSTLKVEQLAQYRNIYSNMGLVQANSQDKVSISYKKNKLKLKPSSISYRNLYGNPDQQQHNIAYLLLELLQQIVQKMGIPAMEAVASNIVLAGGLWRVKGMGQYFRKRIKEIISTITSKQNNNMNQQLANFYRSNLKKIAKLSIKDKIKFVNWKFNPSEVAWIGCSIGASVKSVDSLCLKKSEYQGQGFAQKIMANYFLGN